MAYFQNTEFYKGAYMKRFFSSTLVITGAVLVVAPLIYKYLIYRLMIEIMTKRNFTEFSFDSNLPDYYYAVCLLIGVICIVLGVVFEIKDRNINKPF